MPTPPRRPNLDQLRHQARDLERASPTPITLAQARLALARAYGFLSWAKLMAEAERRARAVDAYAIRPVASVEELHSVFDLIGAHSEEARTHDHPSFSRLGSRLDADRDVMLVAERGGNVVGGLFGHTEGDRVKIQAHGVDDSDRDRGLDRRLMATLEGAARAAGARSVYSAGTSASEKAFYRRLDFVVGRTSLVTKRLPPSIETRRERVAAIGAAREQG